MINPNIVFTAPDVAEVLDRPVPSPGARILRGEIPYPPGLYRHDLLVHKVSLDACNLPTEPV